MGEHMQDFSGSRSAIRAVKSLNGNTGESLLRVNNIELDTLTHYKVASCEIFDGFRLDAVFPYHAVTSSVCTQLQLCLVVVYLRVQNVKHSNANQS